MRRCHLLFKIGDTAFQGTSRPFQSAVGQSCVILNTQHYSTEIQKSEPPLLKVQLRELYKRVHPDLFHDTPFARQANEHSFKLLQVGSTCADDIMPECCCSILRLFEVAYLVEARGQLLGVCQHAY